MSDAAENIRRLKALAALPKEKKQYEIPRYSKKRMAQMNREKALNGDEKDQKQSLKAWFMEIEETHFESGVCACQECGTLIQRAFARHATAHLLPKKLFKSVATHPHNYLILGAGCGCHDKTHRLDTFVKMKVWPIAKELLKELIALLPHDELKYVSSELYNAVHDPQLKETIIQ